VSHVLSHPYIMRTFPLLLAMTALLLGSSGCASWPARDAAAIEGTWIPTTMELSGQAFPADDSGAIVLTIEDGRYLVSVDGQLDKGDLRLEPSARPKAMEIIGTEGPNQGRTFFAIYELTGDTLRICYDLGGEARPSEFQTRPNTQLFLVRYRRAS
jgi:uncharacterized protein (TIGR03067 family)